ncbi:MAG: FtsX-like permease family protein [Allobranchiibius sp.]
MFVAWRDLRSAKGRFALMGTVVTLMTLLVVMLSGLTAGLGKQSTSAITGLNADHVVFSQNASTGPSYSDSALSASQSEQFAKVPGVRAANPVGITSVKADVPRKGQTAGLSAFGVTPASGLAPGAVAAGTVVLSETAADDLSARVGDQIVLSGHTAKVGAISGDASFSHIPVVWTSLSDWQKLSPGAANASVLALTTDSTSALAAADQRLGTDTIAKSASLAAIGSYTSENGSLQMMRGLLFAISALVIGAFFTVWTIQRSRDIAILKALGATTKYLLRDALGQAVVLLLGGTVIGTVLAAAAGLLASGTVPFVLSATTVLIPAAVMIILGAAGAALSVRRITAVDPLTALSGH